MLSFLTASGLRDLSFRTRLGWRPHTINTDSLASLHSTQLARLTLTLFSLVRPNSIVTLSLRSSWAAPVSKLTSGCGHLRPRPPDRGKRLRAAPVLGNSAQAVVLTSQGMARSVSGPRRALGRRRQMPANIFACLLHTEHKCHGRRPYLLALTSNARMSLVSDASVCAEQHGHFQDELARECLRCSWAAPVPEHTCV